MDAKRIAEIRERCNKASEGPWGAFRECRGKRRFGIATKDSIEDVNAEALDVVVDYDEDQSGVIRGEDAEFIAAARQDVPDLLAEVKRLRAENEVLEEALDSLGNFVRENLDYCAADFVGEGIGWAPCKLEYNPDEGNNRCFVNCWVEAFKKQAEKAIGVTEDEQKMKLCSKCGSPAEMHVKPWDDNAPFFVECTNIRCTNRGPEAESKQKAIEGWNKWVEEVE